MRASTNLLHGFTLLVLNILWIPAAHASNDGATGNAFIIQVAQGEPGPPVGGGTGTGGDAGVGNHNAGTERSQSYDTPLNPAASNPSMHNPAASTTSSLKNTTSALGRTTSDLSGTTSALGNTTTRGVKHMRYRHGEKKYKSTNPTGTNGDSAVTPKTGNTY